MSQRGLWLGSVRSVFLPWPAWRPGQAWSWCDGQELPSLAPKAAGRTCPLPEKAGQAMRRLILNGKLEPRFFVTRAICHWMRTHINSLIQTTLPPSTPRSFPAHFGKVTLNVQCQNEGPSAAPGRTGPAETGTCLYHNPRQKNCYSAHSSDEGTEA